LENEIGSGMLWCLSVAHNTRRCPSSRYKARRAQPVVRHQHDQSIRLNILLRCSGHDIRGYLLSSVCLEVAVWLRW